MKQAQEAFSKIDTKTMTNKLHQAIQFMKKKIQDFKKSTENNEIAIKVTNKDAQKQISQIQKQIDSLQEKINARQLKLNIITPQLDKITENTTKDVTPKGLSSSNPAIQQTINNSLSNNKEYSKLLAQEDKITQEIQEYNKQLDNAKAKMSQLNQETSKTGTSQNKLTGFFNAFKGKLEQAKPIISNIKDTFKQIPKITQNITNNIKGIGKGLKQGLGHVLKYAGALFSIRGIYSVLSNSGSSWLSSQNEGAKQLSANIEYLKYSMGGTFAPIIEYVVSLIYKLMQAIQSVVYAFSGINIFAKATASSMNKTANSAKQTSKSLSGIHGEINNVSDNKDSNTSGNVTPDIDLSKLDSQMSPFAQKIYDFFKPLKDSWDTYGSVLIEQVRITAGQVGVLISSVWGSFENIITNGTVYSILENILAVIGNIAEAFSNAWSYGDGNVIVQNLADAFINILKIIDQIVKSDIFQWILNTGVEAVKEFSNAIKFVTEKISEFIGYFTGENQEKLDAWAIILGSIATAIGLVCTALAIYNVVTGIAAVVTALLTSPITLVILAIGILIAAIVAIVMYWDVISAALSAGWEWLSQKATEIFNAIADFLKNLWQGICDTVTNVWNGIKDFFINYFNTVKGIFENIWNGISTFVSNIFNGIKDTISNVLNTIKTIWSNIWNGLGTVVSNVFNRNMELYKGYNKFYSRTE